MVRRGYERVWLREDGLRRVRGVTTWVTAGAAALSVAFGGVFAASRALTTQTSGSQSTQNQQTGTNTDDQGNGGSGGLQQPAQAPGSGSGTSNSGSSNSGSSGSGSSGSGSGGLPGFLGGGQVQSGGS